MVVVVMRSLHKILQLIPLPSSTTGKATCKTLPLEKGNSNISIERGFSVLITHAPILASTD